MPDEPAASTVTETPPSSAVPDLDWNSLEGATPEKFREAVLGEKPPAKAEETPPAMAKASSTEPGKTEEPKTEEPKAETLEDKLAKLEEAEPQESEKPSLDPEQQFILSLFPNRYTVDETVKTLQAYGNFTDAFKSGNFDAVTGMFQEFSPEAWNAFLSHVYTQNIDKWVDQWIEEKEGKSSPRIRALETQVQQLQNAHLDRHAQEQQTTVRHQQAMAAKAFSDHLDKLFNTIEFSSKDRRWVEADVKTRIATDPKAMEQVRTGKFGAVTRHFKEAVQEFVKADQPRQEAAAAKLKEQETRKAPVSAAPAPTEVPTSYAGLKGDQLDSAMDAQLNQLFASAKRKR